MRSVGSLIAIFIFALTIPLPAQPVAVSAHMDIYRAGGYDDGSDGTSPAVVSFPAGSGHMLVFSSVTGSWTCSGGVPAYGPDGTSTGSCYHAGGEQYLNPIGPFAAYASTDFEQGLTGMFLEDGLPSSPPPPLRFFVQDSSQGGTPTNFRVLSPKIGQVFFIGDALTGSGSGSPQAFLVPPTATHLYFGFTDNCGSSIHTTPGCYTDNAGSLTATFRILPENVNWVEPALPLSPSGRCCVGLAYDRATHEIVLFGGFGNPAFYGDTWIWRNGWIQLAPAASPSPREGPGMTYDEAAGNIVLFGGTAPDGTFLNDTWTWDGTTWTQQFPPVSPPGRSFEGPMTYDRATRTVVFFGGLGPNNSVFGDTWTWNGVTKTWQQKFPATSPSPRRTIVAYDDTTKTVVLFGGDCCGTSVYNDTWTWNGITWTQQFPAASPSPRAMASIAYDDELGVITLFGGEGSTAAQQFDDTWVWNGLNWTQIHPATTPPGRWAAGAVYDPLRQEFLVFAGFGEDRTLDDTWLFVRVP